MRGKLLSLLLHLLIVAALIYLPNAPAVAPARDSPELTSQRRITLFRTVGTTGGGGQRSPLPQIARGELPRTSPRPFVPPAAERPAIAPLLPIEPALLGAHFMAVVPQPDGLPFGVPGAGGGPGTRGGIGMGNHGGIGDSDGPFAGGRPGRGILTGPVLLHRVEAEYSDEARKARFQGTVVLEVEVDATGAVARVRVRESIGLGLDEKAVAAVRQWRFRPAMRDGKAVSVPALIEVNFRLL